MDFLYYNDITIIIESFLVAFVVTFVSVPSLIEVARAKNLVDVPNGRTSHEHATPTLGGMAIFPGFIIATMIFANMSQIPYMQYILAALMVVFFLGLKDDVIGLSPFKKFIGEVVAAGIIIDLGNVRIDNLHGFAGLYQLDYYSSDLITLLVIIGIVNAFNLIDGIDGLASGVGIIASLVFGYWFYLVGHVQLTIMAAALTGGLLAFMRFNVFSRRFKIFMGDIGSLVLGFLISIFVIQFNSINVGLTDSPWFIKAAPAVSIGILIVPIYDTVRVFLLRMLRGKSPFHPDRNHVHHRLLDLTKSHKTSTAILLSTNIIFVGLSFWWRNWPIWQLTVVLFALATILSYIPVYMCRIKRIRMQAKVGVNGHAKVNGIKVEKSKSQKVEETVEE